MSRAPTVPEGARGRLEAEGFVIEVLQHHLLVHDVPYVNAAGQVLRGTLVDKFVENAGAVLAPDDHQIWFIGEPPCRASGQLLGFVSDPQGRDLFPGCRIDMRFSNKPEGWTGYAEHYSKVLHYVRLLSDQARVVDPSADARTLRVIVSTDVESVFRYADTASVRSETVMASARFLGLKIAIVGLGGTGAYVLDQVAKTPVKEIHLFDGDEYLQHNAFRAPGAASLDDLAQRMPKVKYYRLTYGRMHRGIHDHPVYITGENVATLDAFDFVFICVDNGPARALVASQLFASGIPFIDVGMDAKMTEVSNQLMATCRATLCTPAHHDHFRQCVDTAPDGEDAEYRQRIQVADMNAMNALLAVMRWKQLIDFYSNAFDPHQLVFSVGTMSLARAELPVDLVKGTP